MDEDTNYEGQDHYHKWLEEEHEGDRDVPWYERGSTQIFVRDHVDTSGTSNLLTELPSCGMCGSADTHDVYFGVSTIEAYSCMDCGNVSATISDEPDAANDDESEVECAVDPDAKVLVHYDIFDNGLPVGAATDKGYHHHISIPYLGFETVKENIKNWAVETGYTLQVTG